MKTISANSFEKGSILLYITVLLLISAVEVIAKELFPVGKNIFNGLKRAVIYFSTGTTNWVKKAICLLLQVVIVLVSVLLFIHAIAIENISLLKNKLDQHDYQETTDLKATIKTSAKNQIRQIFPRWKCRQKSPSYKQVYKPVIDEIGTKDAREIVHISSGLIVPSSTPSQIPMKSTTEQPLKQFPVAPTKKELKEMSVRQLQTLCDRINRISPKSIQGYRRKGVSKRLLQHKIVSFYANLSE